MKYAFVLASAALLASEASASAVLFDRSFKSLIARQSQVIDPGTIAPQCQNVCALTVQALNQCTTLTCFCTNQVLSSTAQCFDCTINVGSPATPADIQQAQATLEELEDECFQGGDDVSSFTVSGAGGSGPTLSSPTAPTASGVIPTGSASLGNPASPSIFFSSSGAAVPSAPAASSASSSPPVFSAPPPVSHITITALSSPPLVPSAPSPSTVNTAPAGSSLNPPASTLPPGSAASGAFKSVSGLSSIAVAGVIGGAMLVMAL